MTRQGLPTFRLVNTAGVPDWDLETSAFGVELAHGSDSPNTGAFRVEHTALINTLVITDSGRVGINTSVPAATLQINSHVPEIRLNPTSSGSGRADLAMHANTFLVQGNTDNSIVRIDTRSPLAMRIDAVGNVGLGTTVTTVPQAKLHVNGNVLVDGGTRIVGDVALGSSRTLKTAFDAVDPAEVLAKLADLPVASWRYKTEDETARHIGPFAEDFQRLFELGDGETISMVDAQGVAFAAIQGLAQRLAEKEDELANLRSEKDAQIVELLARLATVEQRLDAGPPSNGRGAAGGLR
ncbi:MAG TPA: tail fiber domain-containing protein [Acidimicrobiia bacterium]|nr:tail fiber domain-containing protein [Acidimicrobiia bacterium]